MSDSRRSCYHDEEDLTWQVKLREAACAIGVAAFGGSIVWMILAMFCN